MLPDANRDSRMGVIPAVARWYYWDGQRLRSSAEIYGLENTATIETMVT